MTAPLPPPELMTYFNASAFALMHLTMRPPMRMRVFFRHASYVNTRSRSYSSSHPMSHSFGSTTASNARSMLSMFWYVFIAIE